MQWIIYKLWLNDVEWGKIPFKPQRTMIHYDKHAGAIMNNNDYCSGLSSNVTPRINDDKHGISMGV